MNTFHLHLVSDSTGETLDVLARACLVQFDGLEPVEHSWNMVRTEEEMAEAVAGIKRNPGFVLYTMVNDPLRRVLESECRRLKVPCVSVLGPVVRGLGAYLGASIHARPGRQHVMDDGYFNRMAAMDFALSHDDGQSIETHLEADVIVFGVSRTSKTPTCIYLAHRGIRAASIPIVPGGPIPDEVLGAGGPLRVGLTIDPKLLVQIRKNRLRMLGEEEATDYVDLKTVTNEVAEARKLYTENGWPVIDISKRSIEEAAGEILHLYHRRQEDQT